VQDHAEGCDVSINLIDHTVNHTALGDLQVGAAVNVEVDLIARYCERMLGERNTA
jgi:riboflavin synthase